MDSRVPRPTWARWRLGPIRCTTVPDDWGRVDNVGNTHSNLGDDASEAGDWRSEGKSRNNDDDENDFQEFQAAATSLRDHLTTQVALMPLSDRDRALVMFMIEALEGVAGVGRRGAVIVDDVMGADDGVEGSAEFRAGFAEGGIVVAWWRGGRRDSGWRQTRRFLFR